jgi:hypothetical protein
MELLNPALTTLFIAMVYALIKVVHHFISKRNGEKEGHGLTEMQSETLIKIHDQITLLKEKGTLTESQIELLEKTLKGVIHLDELHSVYDDNHVPKWYVPAHLSESVRNISLLLTILSEKTEDGLAEIKGGQAALIDKLSDLINSQRLMTERLGDLIGKLNKLSD